MMSAVDISYMLYYEKYMYKVYILLYINICIKYFIMLKYLVCVHNLLSVSVIEEC